MIEIIVYVILGIAAYILIAGIFEALFNLLGEDDDLAVLFACLWPISIPLLLFAIIICFPIVKILGILFDWTTHWLISAVKWISNKICYIFRGY